jgi:hypothetical protein
MRPEACYIRILVTAGILFVGVCASQLAAGEELTDWSELPNFDELRIERGARDDFEEKCGFDGSADSENPTLSFLKNEDWESAAKSAEKRLQLCPVDIRFHLYMGTALKNLERESQADIHFAWYEGLIESILKSGDGRTVESAFVTISIDEEYRILSVYGLRMTGQAVIDGCDRLEVTDEEGNSHAIFFYPELHWARLAKMFPE